MFECLIHSVVRVVTKGGKPGGLDMGKGYTPEQASLVMRVRSCRDHCEMLGVSRTSSRYVCMYVCNLYIQWYSTVNVPV